MRTQQPGTTRREVVLSPGGNIFLAVTHWSRQLYSVYDLCCANKSNFSSSSEPGEQFTTIVMQLRQYQLFLTLFLLIILQID